jgi:hypothetical protein
LVAREIESGPLGSQACSRVVLRLRGKKQIAKFILEIFLRRRFAIGSGKRNKTAADIVVV